MTANTNLERRVAQHYASEPPLRAPDRVLHAALASIETTRQRRGLLAPRRFTTMNTYAKVAAAAVVAIAVAAVVLWQRPSIGVPTATPTPVLTPTAAPSASPALTGSFTSNMAGLSISYPAGWTSRPATTQWTTPALPRYGDSFGDALYDTARPDHLFMKIASQPLAGAGGQAWADTIGATEPCAASEPIVVDGADGRLLTCNPTRALFWTDDRGYLVLIYRSPDEPALDDVYTAAWFQGVLSTVQVRPADVGTANTFVRPFDYVLPGAPVFDYGGTEARYWEVRVPAYSDAGHPGGLIVQAIGGLVDPCDGASAVLPLDPGADSVIKYLQTIPELAVTDESDTTVDGRPAKQVTVTATSGGADCPEPWVWAEAAEPFIADVVLRLVVVDVDGEHIAVTIFGEPENPELPAVADSIIGSFQFAPIQ